MATANTEIVWEQEATRYKQDAKMYTGEGTAPALVRRQTRETFLHYFERAGHAAFQCDNPKPNPKQTRRTNKVGIVTRRDMGNGSALNHKKASHWAAVGDETEKVSTTAVYHHHLHDSSTLSPIPHDSWYHQLHEYHGLWIPAAPDITYFPNKPFSSTIVR